MLLWSFSKRGGKNRGLCQQTAVRQNLFPEAGDVGFPTLRLYTRYDYKKEYQLRCEKMKFEHEKSKKRIKNYDFLQKVENEIEALKIEFKEIFNQNFSFLQNCLHIFGDLVNP